MSPRILLTLAMLAAAPACVAAGRFDKAMAEKQAAESDVARLRKELESVRAQLADREARLGREETSAEGLQRQLDESTAIDAKLRNELERLGRDVELLLADTNASSVAEAKARLAELRKAQAAAEKRAELYADLVARFKKMLDAGDLAVVVRDGRMLIRLPNDVLFDSGRIEIKPAGAKALKSVAEILRGIDRHFQVAGHTDDRPISASPYASNWELSTARALAVTRFLIDNGVAPFHLSAAGYGEFDPVAPNLTGIGMAKNRRIEIVLQPEIDELVVVPNG